MHSIEKIKEDNKPKAKTKRPPKDRIFTEAEKELAEYIYNKAAWIKVALFVDDPKMGAWAVKVDDLKRICQVK